ncbi:MAG: polysaccharide deacetylase family protein [Bacillota bacterium]|nr:polysaccharide deacetylase family protein [Bacillota bacterium]
MFNGKFKAVTFSYDDGVTQDIRLIDLFNKYGLKATFNINSGCLGKTGELVRETYRVNHTKNDPEDVAKIYSGHEIAAHTLTHPSLPSLSDEDVINQVEKDRLALSELAGYEVVGMAYPGGGVNHDDRVVRLVREHTKIKYARTIISNHSFDIQEDLLRFKPTVYHNGEWDKMFELGEQFVKLKEDKPQILYVWGHAYEFDINDTWDRMEEFCKLVSGHDDIFYGTNKEILLSK